MTGTLHYRRTVDSEGCTDLWGILNDLQRFDFARLGKSIFWIVLVLYLHNKISYPIAAPVFPSWVFSKVSIPKNIGVFIGVIVVIYFSLH